MDNHFTFKMIHSDYVEPECLADLKNFCQLAEGETKQPVHNNMATDFKKNNASLLYLLLEEKRFKFGKGGLLLGYEQDKLFGVSGFYRSDFCSDLFLLGVRSWILKEYRFNLYVANQFIPRQIKAVEELDGKGIAISFNEGNKAFHYLIDKANRSENKRFFFEGKYPEIYHDMSCLPFPVFIKNTKQWVIYKYLKQEFKFDWNLIKWG